MPKQVLDALTGHVFNSPIGWCAVVTRGGSVVRVVLGASSRAKATANAKRAGSVAWRAGQFERRCSRAILDYLKGNRTKPDLPTDLSEATAFQRKVYRACQRIPYGKTRSYRWLAEQVADARYSRAVAGALGANPVPLVVPCHRVVRSDGGLGGFSAPGGVRLKRRLIEMERRQA